MRARSQAHGAGVRHRIVRAGLCLLACCGALGLQASTAGALTGLAGAPTPTWVTNGPVAALARSANTLYIGGSFSEVGPRTGPAVALGAGTGAVVQPAPQLAGRAVEVDATLADGAGGYYVGGNFRYLAATPGAGPTPHAFLVHIRADGSLDPAFAPSLNGKVLALARSGPTLYAGGDFTTVDTHRAHFLVALDAATGALDTAFAPAPDNVVTALALDGGSLIAAGAFSAIGGDSSDHFIGEINPASGAALGGFSAAAGGPVNALAVSGDGSHVYVGGSFAGIGGQPFSNLAELDAGSGAALPGFNPAPDQPVYALALGPNALYVGGTFGGFSSGTVSAADLAALDPATGAVSTTFQPNPGGAVFALLLSGDGATVYAGGQFQGIGGGNASYLAAVSAADGSLVSSFAPAVNNTVFSLSGDGTNVYAGGAFTSAGATPQSDIAAIDLATGAAIPAFDTSSSVFGPVGALALSPDGSTLYVATGFGEPAEAISTATGSVVSSFAPSTNLGPANALAISADGGTLYATGGQPGFGGSGGSGFVVALSTATGNVANGWPTAAGGAGQDGVALNDAGYALALDGADGRLFVGGNFSQVGTSAQGAVAALNPADGSLVSGFNPAPGPVPDVFTPTPNVRALALSPDRATLFVGGLYSGLGGSTAPQNLGAVNAVTGAAGGFAPAVAGAVDAVAETPDSSTVYAGGAFASIGGSPPAYLGEFDPGGTVSTAFAPGVDDSVSAVLPSSDSQQLIIGGNFRGTLGAPQEGVALFGPGPPLPPEPVITPPPAATPSVSLSRTGGARLQRHGKRILLLTGESAACRAGVSCSVTLDVSARVTAITRTRVKVRGRHGKRRTKVRIHRHTRQRLLFQHDFTVGAGQTLSLTDTLTSAQARLVTAATTHKVTEALSARVAGGTVVTASGKVSTRLPPLHRKHRKHRKHKRK